MSQTGCFKAKKELKEGGFLIVEYNGLVKYILDALSQTQVTFSGITVNFASFTLSLQPRTVFE